MLLERFRESCVRVDESHYQTIALRERSESFQMGINSLQIFHKPTDTNRLSSAKTSKAPGLRVLSFNVVLMYSLDYRSDLLLL